MGSFHHSSRHKIFSNNSSLISNSEKINFFICTLVLIYWLINLCSLARKNVVNVIENAYVSTLFSKKSRIRWVEIERYAPSWLDQLRIAIIESLRKSNKSTYIIPITMLISDILSNVIVIFTSILFCDI